MYPPPFCTKLVSADWPPARNAVLQVNPLRWITRAKPVNDGLVPSQVNSGAGRTMTWKPALDRLLASAEVAAPSASESSRTLGPVPGATDVMAALSDVLADFAWR